MTDDQAWEKLGWRNRSLLDQAQMYGMHQIKTEEDLIKRLRDEAVRMMPGIFKGRRWQEETPL